MRLIAILLTAGVLLFSCNSGNKTPDVSSIKIKLTTQRFENDLFALDSNNFAQQLDKLEAKYMGFGEDFVYKILLADPRWSDDTVANYVLHFVKDYRVAYDSTKRLYTDFSPYETEISTGLQYMTYYFPGRRLPTSIITFIGPFDGTGIGTYDSTIYVGLQ